MKTCKNCQEVKNETEFYSDPQTMDRLKTLCKVCYRAKDNELAKGRRKEKAAYQKKYRIDGGEEMRKKNAEKMRKWRAANPEKAKESRRRTYHNTYDNHRAYQIKGYGITLEEYEKMHIEQNGCCSICGIKEMDIKPDKRTTRKHECLCVDHCHKTGKVRGLLCKPCNKMLADAKDDVNKLWKGIDYLTKDSIV